MAWRSLVINNPARLKLRQSVIVIEQDAGTASVPLEDVAVLIIDNPQVTLTSQLLSTCASRQVAVITVDQTHTPNGVFLPYLPHSRALKVMRQQLCMTAPHKKRIWQSIVKRKLLNQAEVLRLCKQHKKADEIKLLASRVKSGDTDNHEAWGAQIYFPALFGDGFSRDLSLFTNAALNYGYSIVRSAIARSLVGYGFLPAFGVHHKSEQNAFNLADDLLEPFRATVDAAVFDLCAYCNPDDDLNPMLKAKLVELLHKDLPRFEDGVTTGRSTLLALVDATVISFGQCVADDSIDLVLPGVSV